MTTLLSRVLRLTALAVMLCAPILTWASVWAEATPESLPIDCSIINLIATPERLDGKEVRVVGYLVVEFEKQALYLSENDGAKRVNRNAVWVSLEGAAEIASRARELNRRYVILEGSFDMGMHGHGGLYSGAIKRLQRLDGWGEQ